MSEFEKHKDHVIIHALVITMLPFSPIPLLDWFLEPVVARRMFAPFMKYPNQRRHFIGKGGSFCLGCITSLLLYPLTKLFKILRFFVYLQLYVKVVMAIVGQKKIVFMLLINAIFLLMGMSL